VAWNSKKVFTLEDGRTALERYCAYQERCQREVQTKIASLGFRGDAADQLLLDAFAADWVSEERFARAYARGKFRSLGWGRIKITHGLRAKGVSSACVALGLSELDPEEYEAAARARGAKEWEAASGVPAAQRRYKVEQALYQRGFESEWARETAPEREV